MALTRGQQQPSHWPADPPLVEALARSPRGPKRQGVYALWLIVRTALDLCLDPPLPERSHRRRLAAVERRISSLTVPAPLRRALSAAMNDLRDPTPATAVRVLRQMVAPAEDTLGRDVGKIVAEAVKAAGAAR